MIGWFVMASKYTKEQLTKVVKECRTWSDVCRAVGVKPATGAQSYIKQKTILFGISFDHFVGHRSSQGKHSNLRKSVASYLNSSCIQSHRLKEKLIREGVKEAKCEWCGITEWMGEPVVLELDHKNNNSTDHRIENVQILCPNCHALKTRHARRNGGMADTRHLECRAKSVRVQIPLPLPNNLCHANRDGECNWIDCPQIRDKEPETTGRHCPIDKWPDED